MSLLFQKIMKFNSLSILLKQGNCWLHKYACAIGVCSRAPFMCSFQSTDPMWGNEWQCVRKLSKCLLCLWQNMRSYILIAEGNISTFNSANWDTLLVGLFNAMAMNKTSLLSSPSPARQTNNLFPEMCRQKLEFRIPYLCGNKLYCVGRKP